MKAMNKASGIASNQNPKLLVKRVRRSFFPAGVEDSRIPGFECGPEPDIPFTGSLESWVP